MGDEMIKLKNNKCILMITIIVLMIVALNILPLSSIHADTNEALKASDAENLIEGAIGWVLSTGAGVLATPITYVINMVNVIIFSILYLIFIGSGISDTIFSFPTPDNVIFNRIGFFDPNFINPTPVASAPVVQIQTVIQSLYYSFFTVAITIFVIAALVIGIKLALSTIASEKAQFKNALKNWVMGIVLLFTIHFLMAGIFAINEEIVKIASDYAKNDIEFNVQISSGIPVIGNALSSIIRGVGDFFGAETPVDAFKVHGYLGLIVQFLVKAIGGDLLSSIALTIILFQTVAIVTMYIKRLFYCIFLGIIAPLVIATDVVKKSMG